MEVECNHSKVNLHRRAYFQESRSPSFGPTIETRMAKKVRQTCVYFVIRASSLATAKNSHSMRMQSLEERLDKLSESSLQMQAIL